VEIENGYLGRDPFAFQQTGSKNRFEVQRAGNKNRPNRFEVYKKEKRVLDLLVAAKELEFGVSVKNQGQQWHHLDNEDDGDERDLGEGLRGLTHGNAS